MHLHTFIHRNMLRNLNILCQHKSPESYLFIITCSVGNTFCKDNYTCYINVLPIIFHSFFQFCFNKRTKSKQVASNGKAFIDRIFRGGPWTSWLFRRQSKMSSSKNGPVKELCGNLFPVVFTPLPPSHHGSVWLLPGIFLLFFCGSHKRKLEWAS